MYERIKADIKFLGAMTMLAPVCIVPLLLMAAYNFYMAKTIQHHPLAQQMLTSTVLLIGLLTTIALIGFLLVCFSNEIAKKIEEGDSHV